MKTCTRFLLLLMLALVLWLTPASLGSPVSAAGPQMYVTSASSGSLMRANLDGTGATNMGYMAGTPLGLAIDPVNGKVYVAAEWSNILLRMNLDGTGVTNLSNLAGFLNGPSDVALDPANNQMYITNLNSNNVVRANLDGTGATFLPIQPWFLAQPMGISLDVPNGKLYITGFISSHITQANLDGTGARDLGDLGGLLAIPGNIQLDLAHGKMYVPSYSNNSIIRANLDGTGATKVAIPGGMLSGPSAIALDLANSQMYITNVNTNSIVRANLDGTGATNLGNPNGYLNYPMGVALYLPTADTTPPTVTITSPQAKEYLHTATFQVTWSAVDTESGIASESAALDGNAVTKGQTVDLFYQSLGAHTVQVMAKDKAGNKGNASVTFTVAANIDSLIAAKERACALGWVNSAEVCSGLGDKLLATQAAIGRGQNGTAKNQLNAFLNQLEAQNGKAVNLQAYNLFKADAQYLIDHLP